MIRGSIAGVEVHEVGNIPRLSMNKMHLTRLDLFLKSTVDRLISIAVLLFIWPFILAVALAVKLDSPGPIFCRRRVMGVGGKPFDVFKFRTLYLDAEKRLAQNPDLRRQFERAYQLKLDPRVTRVGQFLRRFNLDELPQLFNVVRGQMSLIGPRMVTQEEQLRYGKLYMNLAMVKPGITGLWQVSGYSLISFEERLMLDLHYIQNYSLWLDLYVLWRILPLAWKRGHGVN